MNVYNLLFVFFALFFCLFACLFSFVFVLFVCCCCCCCVFYELFPFNVPAVYDIYFDRIKIDENVSPYTVREMSAIQRKK